MRRDGAEVLLDLMLRDDSACLDEMWYRKMARQPIPEDLRVKGYPTWLSYWCRSEVPEGYEGVALQYALLNEEPEMMQFHQRSHPLFSGYNVKALKIFTENSVVPADRSWWLALKEHWDWGLSERKVSLPVYKEALEVFHQYGVEREDCPCIQKSVWDKGVKALLKNRLSERMLDNPLIKDKWGHVSFSMNYKGVKGQWNAYTLLLARGLIEGKTEAAHVLAELKLSRLDWKRVFEHSINDRLTGLDLACMYPGPFALMLNMAGSEEQWLMERKENLPHLMAAWRSYLEVGDDTQFKNRVFNSIEYDGAISFPLFSEEVRPDEVLAAMDIQQYLWLESWRNGPQNNQVILYRYSVQFAFCDKVYKCCQQGDEGWERVKSHLYMHMEAIDALHFDVSGLAEAKVWKALIEGLTLEKGSDFNEDYETAYLQWYAKYKGNMVYRSSQGLSVEVVDKMDRQLLAEQLQDVILPASNLIPSNKCERF